MKKSTKLILIIEVQVILLLLIFSIFKINTLSRKAYNTNKFVHEALKDKRIEDLNLNASNDIVIGESDAPVEIIVYSRFDCSACSEFFTNNYTQLKEDFIDKGKVKLVVRYLVHPSKRNTLYATKCAYYANETGNFGAFSTQLNRQYPSLDTLMIKEIILDLTGDEEAIESFLRDKTVENSLLQKANSIRKAGITSTPTLFINGARITGTRRYSKFKEIILMEL